jgi:hypothetical protein
MAIFDNVRYDGPAPITGEGVPETPGIYLVCTEASGGEMILGVYEGDNIHQSLLSNPKAPCWEKNRQNGLVVYWLTMNEPKPKRSSFCRRTIMNRWYTVPCNDPPRDDF